MFTVSRGRGRRDVIKEGCNCWSSDHAGLRYSHRQGCRGDGFWRPGTSRNQTTEGRPWL